MMTSVKELLLIGILSGAAAHAQAHFLELIPTTDIVDGMEQRTVGLEIVFTHPMENGPVMDLDTPRRFGVLHRGTHRKDLLDSLVSVARDGKRTYRADYRVDAPGDHVFYVEPAPYWEPAEQKMIVHYTKVVVNGFADSTGWDAPVGFPVEIEPLVRPYGLWTGNLFRGIVRQKGRPVPFAELEVEYRNTEGRVTPPSDPFVTQVIKADVNGVFAYAMPRAGWWSFAALIDGDEPMKSPQGKKVDVELGALIWVHCIDME